MTFVIHKHLLFHTPRLRLAAFSALDSIVNFSSEFSTFTVTLHASRFKVNEFPVGSSHLASPKTDAYFLYPCSPGFSSYAA